MSAKFLFPLLLVCFSFKVISQDKPCTKEEIIESYCSSDKFHKAHTLVSSKKLEEAYVLINQLLDEADTNNDSQLRIYSLLLEADLHYQNKSFQKSLATYMKCLNSIQLNQDIKFYTLLNIGFINAFGLSDYEKGVDYFLRAQNLITDESCLTKKTLLYSALGHVNMISGKYSDSENYYLESLNLNLSNNQINEVAGIYNNLGNLYFEQYQDQKAKTFFLKALNTFKIKDSTNINLRQQFNYNLFAVNEALGNYKEAIGYLEKSNTLRDSIWNRDKVWEIADLSKKIALDKKENELRVLEAENKAKEAQRNAVFASALVLLALLGVSIYFYREKVKTNKIITSQNEELDKLNATKDKLFSIVSHDLRSSVNALKSSNRALVNNLETKNIEKLDELLNTNSSIVNGAYNLLDNLLNWAMLQTKQTYFHIEEHRLFTLVEHVVFNYQGLFAEKEIKFQNSVSKKDKILADQESLKIIIRNLMDNAIKFSQAKDSISVYSQVEDENYIQLVIEDSGLGMSETKRLELLKETSLLSKKENENIIGTGLGIQLCKSMIKKNNGKFSIESQLGKGTKMIVSLPKASENG
ncbi:tetratricopeptide repeat-containing sensor histidine kinase [Winogradskyella jejuensis]|uniref:histidine kinase n=1 Tax=Winogradskyella jejuensis TaxID=1089305 RepID=A0A1M5LA94_9FLAO|nr:tetratricopeptide repeat-containing sensor histidine kinase [Winogradskyella jejuensis]SHG62054.1 Signal transduction histidine kinase [Winogradskyella jejuensis]